MAPLKNLAQGEFDKIWKAIRELRYATPLNRSAIGREGLEVYDGGWIRILNGGLEVIGSAVISGTLNVTGTSNFTGPVNISGPLDVTGDTTLGSNLQLVGGGKITAGLSEILSDGSAKFGGLNIGADGTLTSGQFALNPDGSGNIGSTEFTAAGDLKVGPNMTLSPSVDGGSINFQDGSRVRSVGGTVQVGAAGGSGGQFTAGLNTAGLSAGPGGALMGVDDAGEWWMQGANVTLQSIGNTISAGGPMDIAGSLKVDDMQLAPSGSAANLYWDSATKQIYLANP